MAEDQPLKDEQNLHLSLQGTLAIDLGSTNTVVAFHDGSASPPQLLDLAPISQRPGEVPSLIWSNALSNHQPLVGRQVLDSGLSDGTSPELHRDFKRWIGVLDKTDLPAHPLSPEQAGEILLHQIWKRLPTTVSVKRLVLTAPVDQALGYRQWLLQACTILPVDEVALVDEPTAAAMGAGLPAGSKLLVVDLGGGTLDLSLVALEGGEGRAAPLAQLLRFRGRDLKNSKQTLRSARVLGKAGIALGGRDLDHWILDHLFPNDPDLILRSQTSLLNAAERLKCRLSSPDVGNEETLSELASSIDLAQPITLSLNRNQLHALFERRGLIKVLEGLLDRTLASARQQGCRPEDLNAVVAVGGGAHLPLVRQWLSETMQPVPLLTPPPVQAVATGALNLTPGVRIRDLLQKGVYLRCWDRRSRAHHWHPLFLNGQPWPSLQPLVLNLSASRSHQQDIELVLGEPQGERRHEVVFVGGLPTIRDNSNVPDTIQPLPSKTIRLQLNPVGQPGEDCLRLAFQLDDDAQLVMSGEDLRTGLAIEPCTLITVQ
ncbi:Hsp70 family protein [Synechococcus sp. ROS8604]|uniref:Hsp70 family protein n=1 Tax=Synechococcus sp. ROS8604 TaxID=1442557 RepID=UPI00164839D6|nr:Hsp70 family protein [Synechococcus sp. ROS8604]QNI89674.1 chaperone protein DnaK [Synechococcus sp. ROS8604]